MEQDLPDDMASNGLEQTFTHYSQSDANSNETCSTVIIGAGIIGCATAYYLSRSGHTRPDSIHLIEASPELFSSASGKSGGFLAEDWFGPTTASLGELSFRLHQELADEYGGYEGWGYSRGTSSSLIDGGGHNELRLESKGEDWLAQGGSRAQSANLHEFWSDDQGPSWLRRHKNDSLSLLSEQNGTAQVDPFRLSHFLLKQSLRNGVRLHHPARAIKVARDNQNNLSGLRLRHVNGTEFKIPCTRLLITSGAWTPTVFHQLFPNSTLSLPITSLAGHSLVLRSPRWASQTQTENKGTHAIFSTMQNSSFSPEIFSRIGGEIYVAGLNDASIPLPSSPEKAKIDPKAVEEMKAVCEKLLGQEGEELMIVREGLCFRPVTREGTPILEKVEDERLNAAGTGAEGGIKTLPAPEGGVFACAGHGPWGISLSLGTGKVMSEMLEGRELSADVRGLGLR